jgi:hypothetical protein
VRLEGLGQLKNPLHPGLEPATLKLVAYCLNLVRYCVPPNNNICAFTNFLVYSNCLLISQTLISEGRLAKRNDLEQKSA